MTLCGAFWALSLGLWSPYFSLYALELGASKEILGILTMIQTSAMLSFQLLGGIMADRFGRKKVIVTTTIFHAMTPIIYLSATTWPHLIVGLLCNSLGAANMSAINAMIAESLPFERRGAGYGVYAMMTALPRTFTAFIGGVVMDSLGLVTGFRTVLVGSALAAIIVLAIRAKYLTETLGTREHRESRSESKGFAELLTLPRSVWTLIAVACLAGFAVSMSLSFLVVYAVEIVHVTYTEWGIVQMLIGLISTGLSIPGGILSDRFGRKPMILISRILSPVSTLGLVLSKNFHNVLVSQTLSGVGAGLGGRPEDFTGGPAWQALVADMIPSSKRGRVLGLMATISGIAALPASFLGGYIWENHAPALTFWISSIIGLLSASFFFVFVKPPKVRER